MDEAQDLYRIRDLRRRTPDTGSASRATRGYAGRRARPHAAQIWVCAQAAGSQFDGVVQAPRRGHVVAADFAECVAQFPTGQRG